jgi:chromosome segregation ATPase
MERVQAEAQAARAQLEAERRTHAGTQARVQQMQSQLEEAGRQQQALQDGFAAELAKTREAVEAANERAAGAERRALKEVEQERQARARADSTAEAARQKLSDVEAAAREQAVQNAAAVTRLEIDANQAKLALDTAVKARDALSQQVAELQLQLADSHQAEAQTLKALVQRLTPPPSEAGAASPRTSRRKAGSSST